MLKVLISVHNIVICINDTYQRLKQPRCSCFGFPVGLREQRETRSVGWGVVGGEGVPRWTEMHTQTHSFSHSHVICYPICTVTKLPVTPGPSGGCTHSYTLKQLRTHTKVGKYVLLCMYTHTHTCTCAAEVFPVCNRRCR